ncbi:peroxisomal sarcosine oxidase [Aplysia californica]|uniref:Peroxisomal sarcosine oxidase n=1 Tax=Aplysia californica TaxID=6500 RepID=A0ABM1A1T9_APLCA|nr:peroxisomal sarcosine oxidase [Aplysia californica]
MASQAAKSLNYDVIVIGAGIEGSSSAYSLAKSGQKVLLIEQFPLPHGRGSSHGHSRITRYAYEDDFYVRMMVDAFPLWAELQKEAGVEFFVPCGVLDIRAAGSASEQRVVSALRTHNIPHEVLNSSELKARFPAVTTTDGYGAVWDPSGGLLRADKCLAAYQTVFKQLGGVIREAEPVTSLTPGDLVSVVTSRSVYRAHKVVIATGPWTDRFASALNVNLPLRPIRISVLYWKADPERLKEHGAKYLPCILDSRDTREGHFHVYGLPIDEYPGLVKVALHDGPDINPDHRDATDSAWIDHVVAKYVSELLPFLDSKQPALREHCIYTNTPDKHPFIDRHPQYPNVVICAGFSGHGFKLAPAVGKAVTELISGKTPSYNMAPFRLDRFSPKSNL